MLRCCPCALPVPWLCLKECGKYVQHFVHIYANIYVAIASPTSPAHIPCRQGRSRLVAFPTCMVFGIVRGLPLPNQYTLASQKTRVSTLGCRSKSLNATQSSPGSIVSMADVPWPFRVRELSKKTLVIVEQDRFGNLAIELVLGTGAVLCVVPFPRCL